MTGLAERGAALMGGTLAEAGGASGGSLSDLVTITLADGRRAVVKTGPAPRMEAAMLQAIRAAGAPAPKVYGVDDAALAIELLPSGGSLSSASADLGAVLRRLHAATGPHYGWEADYAFGKVVIENTAGGDWPRFYGERRLLTHLPHVPGAVARRLEALAHGLDERLPASPPASLLHGDLWSGNVLASKGRISGLIDPACYHGHGEIDIAMLGLFGSPGPAFFEAYGELEPGWPERRDLYQLWPALVHLRLFGSGYRGMVERLLDAAGV
ncbi:fructosamine kinase family protein [Aurantimonas sp. VKM B-3413]|uniref:fructosamine kinase family protein n=1 Tax=Aurantimonas sp. VKM B-3413 TaxID=2779401 RepID=UPI001E537539|nr:fructosamine kinase family protein [Aurantimonas sp. VKM B-3413]MCB8838900.1 fructosamine kinase family protein [Aurantimonas sp. VKM B-3413]